MNLDLSPAQLKVLYRVLNRQLQATQDELAHTEARKLQHELASDTRELEDLLKVIKPLTVQ